jgi:cytochrome c biogenesis protein CcmG/thiol:disulfide interchange protein DsbE
MKKMWGIIPLVIFLVFSAFFWRGLALNPHYLPSAQLGRKLPVFNIKSLNQNGCGRKATKDDQSTPDSKVEELSGELTCQFSSTHLYGQISILNVWASWCSACMEEQVFLLQLARQGMPIFGLNYKDKSADALQWLSEWGNPYRAIGKDEDGKVAIDLGVYGAPETFLIDANGTIQFRYAGPLNQTIWEDEFLPRIKHLQGKT